MITQQSYSLYENGKTLITSLVLYTICYNHKLSIDNILKKENRSKNLIFLFYIKSNSLFLFIDNSLSIISNKSHDIFFQFCDKSIVIN